VDVVDVVVDVAGDLDVELGDDDADPTDVDSELDGEDEPDPELGGEPETAFTVTWPSSLVTHTSAQCLSSHAAATWHYKTPLRKTIYLHSPCVWVIRWHRKCYRIARRDRDR